MSFVVETGDGLPNATSYASVESADFRHSMSMSADAWENYDLPVKQQRLITATRRLDTFFDWTGAPYRPTQSLGFPRILLFRGAGYRTNIREVPIQVRNAAIDLALWLPEDVAAATNASSEAVQEITLGPIGIKFAAQSAQTSTPVSSTYIPDDILMSLRLFGTYLGGGGGSVGRIIR